MQHLNTFQDSVSLYLSLQRESAKEQMNSRLCTADLDGEQGQFDDAEECFLASDHFVREENTTQVSYVSKELARSTLKEYAKPGTSWMLDIESSHPSPIIIPKVKKSQGLIHSQSIRVLSPGDTDKQNPIGDGEIRREDVLSGRGGKTNHHEGNMAFRNLVTKYRRHYLCSPKFCKRELTRNILRFVRNNKGRFLQRDEQSGYWYEQSDERTLAKIGQLLREGKTVAKICQDLLKQPKGLSWQPTLQAQDRSSVSEYRRDSSIAPQLRAKDVPSENDYASSSLGILHERDRCPWGTIDAFSRRVSALPPRKRWTAYRHA